MSAPNPPPLASSSVNNNPASSTTTTPPIVDSPSTPKSKETSRRSARVSKRDPIVAPGGGTQRDLESLSQNLGLPLEAVTAMMRAQGKGISKTRRGKREEPEAETAPTPISSAWADFMQEEGVDLAASATTTSTAEAAAAEDTSSKTTTTTAPAEPTTGPRTYVLPLVPKWASEEETTSRPAKKTKSDAFPKGGVLVQTGTLDSAMIGRTKRTLDKPYDLLVPTVLLPKIPIGTVIASCNASHVMAIGVSGRPVYGWGRNEHGQLGDVEGRTTVAKPTLLNLPDGWDRVVDGAVGKSHSMLLEASDSSEGGTLYATGVNKVGQCGVNTSTENIGNWRKCVGISNVVQVSCGEAFSVALDKDGFLYTTGSSEFGQLGNGETGEYFIAANKLGFANETKFMKRTTFWELDTSDPSGSHDKVKEITGESIRLQHVSCGKHHVVALEAASSDNAVPRVFTWGCGNYGCLGHGVQADSFRPRLVTALQGPMFASNPPVRTAAGASCSLVLTEQGHVYYFGKHRSVGEATMRPTLLDALAHNGHVVTQLAAGSQTVFCSTKNAVTVSWGQGPHGELGYGPDKKSSSKPQFVAALDKCLLSGLACGQGTTLFIVKKQDSDDVEAVEQLAVLKEKDTAGLE